MKKILFCILLSGCIGSVYADTLLDSAAQLIPQDPNHPINSLAQNNMAVTPTPSSTPAPQVVQQPAINSKSASGEAQSAVMDPEGHWKAVPKQNNVNLSKSQLKK